MRRKSSSSKALTPWKTCVAQTNWDAFGGGGTVLARLWRTALPLVQLALQRATWQDATHLTRLELKAAERTFERECGPALWAQPLLDGLIPLETDNPELQAPGGNTFVAAVESFSDAIRTHSFFALATAWEGALSSQSLYEWAASAPARRAVWDDCFDGTEFRDERILHLLASDSSHAINAVRRVIEAVDRIEQLPKSKEG